VSGKCECYHTSLIRNLLGTHTLPLPLSQPSPLSSTVARLGLLAALITTPRWIDCRSAIPAGSVRPPSGPSMNEP